MTIAALPTPPNRSIPATFADLGDAFLGALPAFVTEANALEANVDAKEVSANASAVAAAASASASAASASASKWLIGTVYSIGNVAWSPINSQSYRRTTNGSGGLDPSLNGTDWTLIYVGDESINRSARVSNTTLVAGDRGKLIDITVGGFSQGLTAAATLGAGWHCTVKNSSLTFVTIDPNGSELIDGSPTLTLLPTESAVIQCTGSAFYSALKVNARAPDFILQAMGVI